MKDLKDEYIDVLENYIKLLNDELKEVLPIVLIHINIHWKSSRVEAGEKYREKIEKLKKKIYG